MRFKTLYVAFGLSKQIAELCELIQRIGKGIGIIFDFFIDACTEAMLLFAVSIVYFDKLSLRSRENNKTINENRNVKPFFCSELFQVLLQQSSF